MSDESERSIRRAMWITIGYVVASVMILAALLMLPVILAEGL